MKRRDGLSGNLFAAVVVVLSLMLWGCDDSNCVSGATQECLCTNGQTGAQSCKSDGSGWEACECTGDPETGSDSDSTSLADSDSDDVGAGDADGDTDGDTDTATDGDTDTDTDGDADIDTDGDTDTDSDGDTDTDGDSDDDSDIDTSVDTDVDTVARGEGLAIVPDDDGWIDATSNALGIQGQWNIRSDDGYCEVIPDGTCASGTIAQVVEDEEGEMIYGKIWGGGVGFDLCCSDEDEDPPGVRFSLGDCMLNPHLVHEFKGVSFNLTGDIGIGPLRVEFAEGDSGGSAYVELDQPGEYTVLMEDARVFWDSASPPANIRLVHSVNFYLPAYSYKPSYDFDFCIENLMAVTEDDGDEAN